MGFFDDGYLGAVVRGIGSNQKQQHMLDYSMFDISCTNSQRSLHEAEYSSSPVGLSEAAVDTFAPETSPEMYNISKAEEIDLHEIFDSTSMHQSPPLIMMEGSHSPPSRYSSSSKQVKQEIMDHVGIETAAYGRSQSVSSGSLSGERNSVVDPQQQFPGDLLSTFSHSVSSSEAISSKTWPASPKNQTNASAKRSDSSTSKQQGSKRRKGQQKRVVCVPIAGAGGSSSEVLPSDMWAWRKYGQKPIKGSPYPRGYYRCSSSKGCSARKQVERSRTDPSMLVVTYTSEHNHAWPAHRNSLAGTTRSKPLEKLRIISTAAAVHSSSSSQTILTQQELCSDQLPSPAEESVVSEASIVEDHLLVLDNAADMASSHEDQQLFQDLDELPELATFMDESFFSYRQYDDSSTGMSMGSVDPFDLFCWSSSSL